MQMNISFSSNYKANTSGLLGNIEENISMLLTEVVDQGQMTALSLFNHTKSRL